MKHNCRRFLIGKCAFLLMVVAAFCFSLMGCGAFKPSLSELSVIRINSIDRSKAYGSDELFLNINYDTSTLDVYEGTATCRGTVNQRLDDYFSVTGSATSIWLYHEEQREWKYADDTANVYCVLDEEVEGTWGIYDSRDCIYVDNQTATGLDVYVEGYSSFGDDWVHVELKKSLDSDIKSDLLNHSRGCAVYTGKNADGNEVKVTFFMSFSDELGIEVKVSGSREEFGYYRDFTPSN